VPNAGGAPGGSPGVFCDLLRHPAAAPSKASVECVKNCLRVFDIFISNRLGGMEMRNLKTNSKGLGGRLPVIIVCAFHCVFGARFGMRRVPRQ
jgi:hypothetical protein